MMVYFILCYSSLNYSYFFNSSHSKSIDIYFGKIGGKDIKKIIIKNLYLEIIFKQTEYQYF